MTHQNDNSETPPAVDPADYENPPKGEQRSWIQGTNLIILIMAAIVVVIVLVYAVWR